MNESDITNLVNIRNEAPERIKILAASTPSGKRESFYRWCTGAPHNGWREHYAPSTVNQELHKINPDTGKTYLQELQEELPRIRFIQEVLAEFGEEEGGVYRKVDIDRAIQMGRELGIRYVDGPFPKRGPRVLGIDWDKSQAGVSMVSVEWNYELGKFVPFHAEEIPRTEFTLDNGVKRADELDQMFEYDYIVVDRGYGEYQVERLTQLLNARNPGSHRKIIAITLSDKINVRNPVTRRVESAHIKPWIVNQSVLQFERGLVALNPDDRRLIEQLQAYRVVSISADGRPTYSKKNEHFVDALNFALYGLIMNFSDITKVRPGTAIAAIPKTFGDPGESQREIEPPSKKKVVGGVGLVSVKSTYGRGGISRLPRRIF